MASIPRRLLLYSNRCPSRISPRQLSSRHPAQWQRSLTTSTARYENSKDAPKKGATKNGATKKDEPNGKPASQISADSPSKSPASGSTETQALDPSTPRTKKSSKEKPRKPTSDEVRSAQLEKLMKDLASLDPEAIKEAQLQGKRGLPWMDDTELYRDEDFEIEPKKGKIGFWGEGQEELGPDEDYYADDITSHGHGQLEEHRELREYARLIAWELPLLNDLARPFELPTAATPFRFRYTSYLGEPHPATNKVVVEFSASDMKNLTPLQRDKLIKLSGPRYNPSTDIIKMSCESFDSLAQNKRFLGDTISKLLAEARNGEDTFADVPFDFRHHKPKTRHVWPEAWNLTPERKLYLEEKRSKLLKMDDERTQNGNLVDGQKMIENALPFMAPEKEPVMVGGPRGKALR